MVNSSLNLLLNELKLITENRNISDYENKSEEQLIKALRRPKPKLGIKNNNLKEIKEDFYDLKHRFSKKDVDKYRKVFYDIKNYIHLSGSEIEEVRKNFNELEKSLNLKRIVMILIVFLMKTLIIMMTTIFLMMMMINTEKPGVLEHYLKSLIEIITKQ